MTNEARACIDGLPVVPSNDPCVVNPIEVPATEHVEETHRAMAEPGNSPRLGEVLYFEARTVFMLLPRKVRSQLLSNPQARNALNQFLCELVKDEELGDELRKRNPTRYPKLEQDQS